MKFIDKKDIANREISELPIRRGCLGICACLGICQNIEGYVNRAEYEAFMDKYVSLEQFLTSKIKENPKK